MLATSHQIAKPLLKKFWHFKNLPRLALWSHDTSSICYTASQRLPGVLLRIHKRSENTLHLFLFADLTLSTQSLYCVGLLKMAVLHVSLISMLCLYKLILEKLRSRSADTFCVFAVWSRIYTPVWSAACSVSPACDWDSRLLSALKSFRSFRSNWTGHMRQRCIKCFHKCTLHKEGRGKN